ncbi:MAG: 50S ribosomal protein L6 [Candidatus Levybacteria bacterium]|nr:50S ribosomal protein L6 [Candidatus Levybacteria bacterium]
MSKIGKIPVILKEGTTVIIENGLVKVTGPKATLTYKLPSGITAQIVNGKIEVKQEASGENTSALFGLTRSLLENMVQGVTSGFEKKLELSGVGYRAQGGGSDIALSVGFSHPVKIKAPQGVSFAIAENVITVSGTDKILVGDTAARIRAVRPPEPYKGKGIKYVGERIRRKVGKAAKAVGAK